MTEETEEGVLARESFKRPDPSVISLDLELSTLTDATRGAQILSDLQARKGLVDEPMEKDAPMCIFFILALVVARMDHVRRVLRGEENPAHISAPHNEIPLPTLMGGAEGDVLLFSWDELRGSLAIGKGSIGADLEGKLRERKAKEPKGPKGRKGKKPKGSLSVVPGEEPKNPPPSSPESP